MTSTAPPAALTALLQSTRHVLLDFDGPVCNVFAGLPASAVADRLRELLARHGVTLPKAIERVRDPHALLGATAWLAPSLTQPVDAALRAAELEAVASAAPTPHADELIGACHASGRRLAVVSNNDQQAISVYLAEHGVARAIDVVVAVPLETQP